MNINKISPHKHKYLQIIDTIDKYGLKQRNLNKHNKTEAEYRKDKIA